MALNIPSQDVRKFTPASCSHSNSSANHSKQGIGYSWPCAILGWLVSRMPHSALSVHLSICLSVSLSVGPSITLYFCSFWPHCSCSNDQVTSNTAPIQPPCIWPCFQSRATRLHTLLCLFVCPSIHLSVCLSVQLSIPILLCPPVRNNFVTPRHLFSFLLVLILTCSHDKWDLSKLAKKKNHWRCPKNSFLYKIALKNAPEHLLKRTDQ